MAGIQDIIGIKGIKGIQSIRDPILRKYDTFSTGIKDIIGIQGIQSPLSNQCCPSATDWYKRYIEYTKDSKDTRPIGSCILCILCIPSIPCILCIPNIHLYLYTNLWCLDNTDLKEGFVYLVYLLYLLYLWKTCHIFSKLGLVYFVYLLYLLYLVYLPNECLHFPRNWPCILCIPNIPCIPLYQSVVLGQD